MNTKLTLILASLLIITSIVLGVLVYDQLPEQVASHWNEKGEVDDYMSKFWGTFMMPIISLLMLALFLVIPHIDPLKKNIAEFREIFNAFIFVMMLFMTYIWAIILAWNLGKTFNMNQAILPALGLLFIFIGYMVGKAKRNWFVGIRTPWTLSSETVWDEVHRIGGTLFMLSGFITLLGVFFRSLAIWFTLVPIFATSIFLYVYSYVLYQREINTQTE